ncbi:1-aminocyclopropane-1-carboxylate oxidase homolog 1 [Linum perenne]
MAELKSFDESKAGVKGLVDSGIKEIPRIFHAPPHFMDKGSPFSPNDPNYKFPIIDLAMVHDPIKRKETVDQIRNEFFELDVEQKKEFYDREATKKVMYSSNPDMYRIPVCSWTDLMLTHVTPEAPKPEELPECCKEIVPIYTSEMNKLGDLLFELLSEGLGLESNHLKDMGCMEAVGFGLHYYPACPQPELAVGFVEHTDIDFLTVILQDEIGGLQVKRHNSWIDVPLKAQKVGPRITNATFFGHATSKSTRMYGPIKELVSENNPPIYKEITIRDFFVASYKKGIDGTSLLPRLKLDNSAPFSASSVR